MHLFQETFWPRQSLCLHEFRWKYRSLTHSRYTLRWRQNNKVTLMQSPKFIPCFYILFPSYLAVVSRLCRSLPAAGSVIAIAPMNSPEMSFGKYFDFCSSDPYFAIYGSTISLQRTIYVRVCFDLQYEPLEYPAFSYLWMLNPGPLQYE